MNNSTTEIAGIITKSFGENLENLLMERKDISEFIVQIKKTLDNATTGEILDAEIFVLSESVQEILAIAKTSLKHQKE